MISCWSSLPFKKDVFEWSHTLVMESYFILHRSQILVAWLPGEFLIISFISTVQKNW